MQEERIVKRWADNVLFHTGANKYQLARYDGQPIGDLIRAASDEEAIEECIKTTRQKWDNEQKDNGSVILKILERLESSNKYEMLEVLNDDELQRLKGMFFVWHDLAKREVDRRKA